MEVGQSLVNQRRPGALQIGKGEWLIKKCVHICFQASGIQGLFMSPLYDCLLQF